MIETKTTCPNKNYLYGDAQVLSKHLVGKRGVFVISFCFLHGLGGGGVLESKFDSIRNEQLRNFY